MSPRVSVAVIGTAALLGCGRSNPPRSATEAEPAPALQPASRQVVSSTTSRLAEEPGAPDGGPQGGGEERLDDAQVLGAARSINGVEIDQAKLAIGRARDDRVKDFASRLIASHGRADKELARLEEKLGLTASDSNTATQLRIAATAGDNDLSEASGATFDKLFVETQIAMHERLLEAFERTLLPQAAHPELKLFLQRMRPRMESHLKTALALREQLD